MYAFGSLEVPGPIHELPPAHGEVLRSRHDLRLCQLRVALLTREYTANVSRRTFDPCHPVILRNAREPGKPPAQNSLAPAWIP